MEFKFIKNYKGCVVKDNLDGVSVKIWDCGIVQVCHNRYFRANVFLNHGQMVDILVNAKNLIERNYYEREGSK